MAILLGTRGMILSWLRGVILTLIDAQKGQNRVAAQSAADQTAAKQYVLRQTIAAQEAADAAARAAAARQSQEALSLEALRQGVPAGRREAVTRPGEQGFRQALNEVNAAYDEAWGTATNLRPGTIATVIDEASNVSRLVGETDANRLRRFIADAEKLGEEGGSVAVLDEILRNQIDSASDSIVRGDLERIRNRLRSGLPEENLAMLSEVDAVYPAFLTSQAAGASAGLLTGGLPTTEQYAQAANRVAGQRRAAAGEQPLRDVVPRYVTPEPPVRRPETPPPEPRTPTLERSLALDAQRKQVAREKADRLKDVQVISKKGKERLAAERDAALEPVVEARNATKKAIGSVVDSPYMAALMASALPGSGFLLPKAGLVSYLGRKSVSPGTAGVLLQVRARRLKHWQTLFAAEELNILLEE